MKIKQFIPIYNVNFSNKASSEEQGYVHSQNLSWNFPLEYSQAVKNEFIANENIYLKTNNETSEIIKKLKKEYGINAEFENVEIAKITYDCIKDFCKINNSNIFEGLVIKSYKEENDTIKKINFNKENKTFELHLNNALTLENIKKISSKKYDNCDIVSNNPKCEFYEGLGEFLYFKENPRSYSREFNRMLLVLHEQLLEQFDYNSKNSSKKIVGSFIASKMCKETSNPGLKSLYKLLDGPSVNLPETKQIKPLSDKKFNFNTIKEAVEYLKKYGIKADFDNLICANLAVGAIEDFIVVSKHQDLFRGLTIKYAKHNDEKSTGYVAASYNHDCHFIDDLYICFNSLYDWQNHAQNSIEKYEDGRWASSNPKNSFYHELSHWLDVKHNPKKAYCPDIDNNDNDENKIKKIQGKVSGYSQVSTMEFIAEYITGKMCGHKYPKSVDELYRNNTNIQLSF